MPFEVQPEVAIGAEQSCKLHSDWWTTMGIVVAGFVSLTRESDLLKEHQDPREL